MSIALSKVTRGALANHWARRNQKGSPAKSEEDRGMFKNGLLEKDFFITCLPTEDKKAHKEGHERGQKSKIKTKRQGGDKPSKNSQGSPLRKPPRVRLAPNARGGGRTSTVRRG